ncbi:Transcriptional regulator [Pseudomonas brassicacearum]
MLNDARLVRAFLCLASAPRKLCHRYREQALLPQLDLWENLWEQSLLAIAVAHSTARLSDSPRPQCPANPPYCPPQE